MDLIAAAANAAEPAAPRSTKGTTDEKILQLRNSFYLCGQAQENAAWQNYKDKKTDEVKKLVSPELVAVYATGASNLQSELETMAKWDMKSFTLSNYQVTMSDAETAVCTYQVKLDGTLGGTDMSGMHNCATIWQMQKRRLARHFPYRHQSDVVAGAVAGCCSRGLLANTSRVTGRGHPVDLLAPGNAPRVDFIPRASSLEPEKRGSHWLRVRRAIVGDPLNLMRVMPS